MISVDGLTVEFGGTTLFKDISFQINEKDRIALMGKNGAGKSTLLKILAGVRQPTRGNVSAPKDTVIAYLPQHLMTEDGRTVFEEACQPFEHLKDMEREIEALNAQLMERTDYESDDYMALIEQVAAMSEKFYAIDLTHFEEDVEKMLLGLGFERSDFARPTTVSLSTTSPPAPSRSRSAASTITKPATLNTSNCARSVAPNSRSSMKSSKR